MFPKKPEVSEKDGEGFEGEKGGEKEKGVDDKSIHAARLKRKATEPLDSRVAPASLKTTSK